MHEKVLALQKTEDRNQIALAFFPGRRQRLREGYGVPISRQYHNFLQEKNNKETLVRLGGREGRWGEKASSLQVA